MSKAKRDRANLLDPNRERIAKQNALMPGGPENNNPMNVTDNASPPIQSASIYGDYKQQYAQMGSGVLNPMMVNPSGLQQNFPLGRGQNGMAPYGMQQQPDTSGVSMAADGMESGRLAKDVQMRGVPAGPMCYQGMPAEIPGAFPGAMPGTTGPQFMPGMPSAEQAAGKGINMKTGKRGK